MYEQALCTELEKNNQINIEYVNIYQTQYWPNDKLLNRSKGDEKYKMLGFINLPFVREFSYFISTLLRLIKWNKRIDMKKDKIILTSTHFTPVSAAVVIYSKIAKIKRVVTFTDLSLFTFQENRIRGMKWYKKIVIKPYVKLTNYLQTNYDGYILFSKPMLEVVNAKLKPCIILEGIYNEINVELNSEHSKKNAIAHAGTLSQLVGINNILDTFSEIKLETKLWLMGSGDMNEEITLKSKMDSRIEFLGFIPKKEVFKRLQEARVLLILRNINDEYTKYSFPSKLFEYMVSGTPVITTRLKGIPDEYYPYLYLLDTMDAHECAKTISEILKKSDEELFKFGNEAKNFILKNKNAKKQSERVVKLLYRCLDDNK